MKIVLLDYGSLGPEIDLSPITNAGELTAYEVTTAEQIPERIRTADVVITNVVLRPSCSGLYFKGGFTFGAHETVSRYGIAVSLYNDLPVADDSDATSLYTVGENSVLISNILGEGKDGKTLIYARPYALLEDGTYIYGDVVVTNLKSVVETIDAKFDTLTTAQQTVVADLYRQNTAAMQDWLIPKIKELV